MNNNKIIWLTGQPGSGKTTLANLLEQKIKTQDSSKHVVIIDGDDLRDITTNKDYSKEGRKKNIKTAQKIAQFLFNKNFIVIVSLIAPYRDVRESFKSLVPVLEIFLHTKEKRGREHFFVKDYEPPQENFLDIDTGLKSEHESVSEILLSLDN